MRRFLSFLWCTVGGVHMTPAGVDRRWSVRFTCCLCGDVVDGGVRTRARVRR